MIGIILIIFMAVFVVVDTYAAHQTIDFVLETKNIAEVQRDYTIRIQAFDNSTYASYAYINPWYNANVIVTISQYGSTIQELNAKTNQNGYAAISDLILGQDYTVNSRYDVIVTVEWYDQKVTRQAYFWTVEK